MLPLSSKKKKSSRRRIGGQGTMLWTKLLALGMIFCVGTMMVFVTWRSPGIDARLNEIDRLEESLEKKMNVLENEMIAIKTRLDMDAEKRNQQEHQIRKRRRFEAISSVDDTSSEKNNNLKPIPISIEKNRKRDSSSATTTTTRDKIAVLVICYNRPDYLRHTLNSLFERMPNEDVSRLPVIVSQDGNDPKVRNVVRDFESVADRKSVSYRHMQHPQTSRPGDTGYHKLARHFKWAFDKVFRENSDVGGVIVLEDDMEIAVDFFEMFLGLLPVLQNDPTLFTISAWNDNGKPQFASDPKKIYRSDFFPGLGWIMTRNLWNELGPKWPDAYWDDWLRDPAQRKGRACLRPEVSRTHNFGAKGVSHGQYYNKNIAPVKLNDEFVPFREMKGLTKSLTQSNYDPVFKRDVNNVLLIQAVAQIRSSKEDVRLEYDNLKAFKRIAKQLGIMDDEKAGVPRTAYMGVVTIKFNGHRVHIAPRGGV